MKAIIRILALVGLVTTISFLMKNPQYLKNGMILGEKAYGIIESQIQDSSPSSSPNPVPTPEIKKIPKAAEKPISKTDEVGLADQVAIVSQSYFSDLNKGRYKSALEKLSLGFQRDKGITEKSLANYWSKFTLIRLVSIRQISKKGDGVHVFAYLRFEGAKDSEGMSGEANIRLVQVSGSWKIDGLLLNQ